jgi:hypothetical protein
MKDIWFKFKLRFHNYVVSIEDRTRIDPLFIFYLLWELCKISFLVGIIYLFYKFINSYILWRLL